MFVCLDIETTGLSPKEDHIIEVAIVRFDHEKILDQWSSLLRCPIKLPEFTKRLTGISDEMLKDAPSFEELKETILEKLGDAPIVGHYIQFDVGFLIAQGLQLPNPQLDTFQLVQALLTKEPSYSLEVLAEKLEIPQTDAHRALDDVKANIELFWKLFGHLRALKSKEKSAIKTILSRSTWPWAESLLSQVDKKGGMRIPQTESTRAPHSETHASLKKLTEKLKTPFLFEEASHTTQDLIDYAKTLDGQVLLVVPDLSLVPKQKDLSILKHPSQYLDEDRFKAYVSKSTLGPTETLLGLKIALWLEETETGEKSELRMIKEEEASWHDIACQDFDAPNSFFKKARDQAKKSKIAVVNHLHFLKDRSRKDPELELPDQLVIAETELLPDETEQAWHIRFGESTLLQGIHEETLSSKVSILFGFLGMLLQKYSEDDLRQSLIIEPHHKNTGEWKKIRESAESIQNALQNLPDSPHKTEAQKKLNYLVKMLSTEGQTLWITLTRDQTPLLHAFPENGEEIFRERVWNTQSQLHLFCHHGRSKGRFDFLLRELALPKNLSAQSSEEIFPLPLRQVQSKISSPNEPSNLKEVVHELSAHLPEIKGNVLLLVTSKFSAEQFFYALPKLLQETGHKLFVQNMSGGMGKILKMSEKSEGHNFFVGNQDFLNFLLNEGRDLHFLIVHRFPFSPPHAPIQKARSKKYQDTYLDFALPQAQLNHAKILSRFLGNEWTHKEILIVDPRADQLN